jgi:hypothetical protein
MDTEALNVFSTIPMLDTLESLRVRSVPLGYEASDSDNVPRIFLSRLVRLVRLRSLCIRASHEIASYLQPALTVFKAALRDLHVGQRKLDTAKVIMLSEQFPQLHSIGFAMERTLSLLPETDIYTALAKFPVLRSVNLSLKYKRDIRAPLRMWSHGRSLNDTLDRMGRGKSETALEDGHRRRACASDLAGNYPR